MWLFAYGSLLFRPGFEYRRKVRAFVEGYERRFWQASIDHRGTHERPGRVVTLVANSEARCWGAAYELDDAQAHAYLASLDQREIAGYERREVVCWVRERTAGAPPQVNALTYVADATNPYFVDGEPLVETARVVRASAGPSGHNVEYVLRLAEALADLGAEDTHVFELANLVSDPDAALEEGGTE